MKLRLALVPYLLAGACTFNLPDGAQLDSRFSESPVVPIQGMVPLSSAGQPIDLWVQDPNGGPSNIRGVAFPNPSSPFDFGGSQWIPFDGIINVGVSDGFPGKRGHFAIVGASGTLASRKDAASCFQNVDHFIEYWRQCSSLGAMVCSSDFIPLDGPRRVGCPHPRAVRLNGTEFNFRRGPDSTALSLKNTGLTEPSTQINLEYRGDKLSFLDVYDSDLSSTSIVAREGSHGSAGSAFIRLPVYTHDSNDPSFDFYRINGGSVVPGYEWQGTQSVRLNDRGACSVTLPWRTLLNEFVVGVEAALLQQSGDDDLLDFHTSSRSVLTPILRTSIPGFESTGAFSYVQTVTAQGSKFGFTGQMRALLRVTMGVTAQGGALESTLMKLQLEKVNSNVVVNLAEAVGNVDTDRALERARNNLRGIINGLVGARLAAAGMNAQRVNFRPEGIEVVLLETRDDPLFPLANGVGACRRTEPRTDIVSFFGPVFDPPLATDPEVFRDTKNPGDRLQIDMTRGILRGVLMD